VPIEGHFLMRVNLRARRQDVVVLLCVSLALVPS
jgi:hypothetical protein